MKENKKVKNAYTKYIIGSILGIIAIIISVCLIIHTNAENVDTKLLAQKVVEEEKALVKMTASLSRAQNSSNVVNATTLANDLNKYAGIGKTTVTEKSSDTLVITFVETGHEYTISINTGGVDNLPSTNETTPYLPEGYTYLNDTDLETGLVIEDGLGNQYVWVEVPRNSTLYATAGLNITQFTDEEYTKIENDLHTYTSVYRNGTSYKDEYYSDEATGLTSSAYSTQKKKMLKSVYTYGGFYIGRYEAGIEAFRTEGENISDTLVPMSKENQYPLTYVTCSEAQTLASRVASGEYTSSLMFGVQWDLVLKYLETKGTTQSELNSDSTNWGNCYNSTYTLNRGKYAYYSNGSLSTWYNYTADLSGIVESSVKKASNRILYTTGASDQNRKQNIYDFAGNAYEWTLEYTSNANAPCTERGSHYYFNGFERPANYRGSYSMTYASTAECFRVALYKDLGT